MYAYENDRREYVRGHDDDRVAVNVHACAHENECVHVCVLRAHVNEHVHDDVRSRARGGGHVRDGDDDQSHQRCHDLFHRVPYAHRSLFPKYYFSRCGLHEDDNRRAKLS